MTPRKLTLVPLSLPALSVLFLHAQESPPGEGLRYFAVEDLATHRIEQRGRGSFEGLLLGAETEYRAWVLEAETLLVGRLEFRTGPPGGSLRLPEIALRRHSDLDEDQDGLPDLAEQIVGTDPRNPDSDGDGLADGAEVRQALDPLDGIIARTGVIASVDTPGLAGEVSIFNDVAIVADGPSGIIAFNVFNGLAPIRIAQVDTPGFAQAVSCSGEFIAVGDGANGLAIVDFTDPRRPRLSSQIPLRAPQAVETTGPLAYAVAGVTLPRSEIVLVDMPSGAVLDRRSYSEDPVQDLAIAADALYLLTASSTGHAVRKIPVGPSLGEPTASFVGAGRLKGRMRLAAGGGFIYVAAADPPVPSELTGVEIIRDRGDELELVGPASPLLAFDVAVNGSGLALYTGSNRTAGDRLVSVLDVREPAATDRILRTFDTPGSAEAVAIYNGLAYVADRERGLQVLAYELYEPSGGAPPAVSLSFSFPDDPPRAEEGQLVRVSAAVEDDVQARTVEFYVDGRRVATDGSFPFEHRFVAPARGERTSFTLRARAFDTAGNSTFSDEVVVALVDDATRPTVVRTVPPDLGAVPQLRSTGAFFSEQVDPQSLAAAGAFILLEAGADRRPGTADDRAIAGGALEYRQATASAFLSFAAPLSPGIYRARLAGTISDLAGNRLDDDATWSFAVLGASPADTDGDGLPDVVEIVLSLDPLLDFDPARADTDGDGIPDGAEDIDRDGATNAQEIALGFDPRRADTDGDGILDGQEDSDLDLLRDVAELAAGTDPLRRDTDGDGFPDGDEVADASGPTDPLSIPVRSLSARLPVRNVSAPAAVERRVEGRPISVRNLRGQ